MMGVSQTLVNPPQPVETTGKLQDLMQLIYSVYKMKKAHGRLDQEIAAFLRRTEQSLANTDYSVYRKMTLRQLRQEYHRLEEELLNNWQAPLVNDFFAMIYFGILGRLVNSWLPDLPESLVNDLVSGEGNVTSTLAAEAIMQLAAECRNYPGLESLMTGDFSDSRILDQIKTDTAFHGYREKLETAIQRYGDRYLGELKLESITPREDAVLLLGMIRACHGRTGMNQISGLDADLRKKAESLVTGRISGIKKRVFDFVLRQTRARVRDRENQRFERTRVFGAVRRIFNCMGAHFARAGVLKNATDIFDLQKIEIFSHIEGSYTAQPLQELVTQRQAGFLKFVQSPDPPERVETRGAAESWQPYPDFAMDHPPASGELKGLGCCPGKVKGTAVVVREPSQARDLAGKILVAQRTDPGWTVSVSGRQRSAGAERESFESCSHCGPGNGFTLCGWNYSVDSAYSKWRSAGNGWNHRRSHGVAKGWRT